MYSFLMIGQSNMAGRGFKDEVPAIENDKLYVLRNGRWHQGEADCREERYPFYEEKCIHIFESLKSELGLSDEVPFIVGGLGSFLAERGADMRNYIYINETLRKMERNNDYVGFVSAEGLTSNPDYLHFNAKSLREFGVRYFEKFKQMNKVIESGTVDSFADNLTELERL